MGKDVIVACDFSSAEATFAFLDKFTGRKPFVKIGMELYYAEPIWTPPRASRSWAARNTARQVSRLSSSPSS